jgi:hypothetical protein
VVGGSGDPACGDGPVCSSGRISIREFLLGAAHIELPEPDTGVYRTAVVSRVLAGDE